MNNKSSSQPSNRNTASISGKSKTSTGRRTVVPRTMSAKKVPSKSSKDSKSLSSMESGIKKSRVVKPKKTTKSEVCCSQNVIIKRNCSDHCKKCGDVLSSTTPSTTNKMIDFIKEERQKYSETHSHSSVENSSQKSSKGIEKPSQSEIFQGSIINNKINPIKIPLTQPCVGSIPEKLILTSKDPARSIQQYYKNENFQQISDSVYEINNEMKKISLLDTIEEMPEVPTAIEDDSSSLESTLFRIINQADTELHTDEYTTLQKLKAFRDNNYFECHNTQTRIKSKGSVTSLENHECTYRFYLNERLFPEPLNMDHNQNIRCVECHLPMELKENSLTSKRTINGAIQAKVKIGPAEESQDTLLMLPVKDSLIIREKRKERRREAENPDIVYFGIIKLDAYGNSVFNKTLPENSLALRYQKGYKKFEGSSDDHSFQRMEEGDIVYV
ncbi:uncharacterized protein LOC113225418 [Hyposmocoma kahamanoa]|uniref:uncharacterized protein LOC113225418 n=1 Tax=Hyposmocoma kahamanoa TaxID=1477025 RepID=UPI000E6D8C2F|nr:uncharacterized protein LOC113225418 [Hyposmocoma kahamanoa]